ncbi:hypothetical protein [Gilvimarinus xylanilyticus]|uniref:Secreted protein n=1 Tax=Gilvimarinus xylanilyticus TaxID=2944139 RepID=A0A9X2KVA9_9GAMM|nr:hypothetical protein [Gilvimarinus xylanilyticus]MCP8901002.1 hypothetical protein [Gilvimarinus xylanilyticus]
MKTTASIVLSCLLSCASLTATASPRQMGLDFRTMLSNYNMLSNIKQRCAEASLPDIPPRQSVEKQMQNKVGMQNYINLMIKINQSNLKKDAADTVEKLFGQLEGCEDPRLEQALARIGEVHNDAYQRFEAEPALVEPNPVPVPLRR